MRSPYLLLAMASAPLLAASLQPASLAQDTSVPPPPTSAQFAQSDSLKLAAFASSFAQGIPASDSLELWQPPPPDSLQGQAAALHAQGIRQRDSLRTWLAQTPDSLQTRVHRLRAEAQQHREAQLQNLTGFDRDRIAWQLGALDLSVQRRRHAIETSQAK